jgi:hypothetical protein
VLELVNGWGVEGEIRQEGESLSYAGDPEV